MEARLEQHALERRSERSASNPERSRRQPYRAHGPPTAQRSKSVATLPQWGLDMIANQNALPNTIETALRNLFAGAIAGVITIVYCVSYAAFIFSGPLAPWLSYGIAATFISTTVGALVVALRSSLPFTIAGPDSATSVVTAGLVAGFVGWLVENGRTDHILEPTL